jgi:hypothetical protein
MTQLQQLKQRIIQKYGLVEILHKSVHQGHISSYYLVIEGYIVRVSDHDLPETLMRSENRAYGHGCRFDIELVLQGEDFDLEQEQADDPDLADCATEIDCLMVMLQDHLVSKQLQQQFLQRQAA